MTLASRNTTLRIAYAVVLLYAAFTVVMVTWVALRDQVWRSTWVFGRYRWAIVAAVVSAGTGLFLSVGFVRVFRRSSSVAVFFAVLYLLLSAVDVTKLWHLFDVSVIPMGSQVLATRVVHFGHLLGTFSLFASSLYAVGVRFQRHGMLILLGGFVALALIWALPIDTTVLQPNLTFRAGLRTPVALSVSALVGLSVINYVYAGVLEADIRFSVSTSAVAGMAVGREALFFASNPVVIILAGALMVTGATLYAFRSYRDYTID